MINKKYLILILLCTMFFLIACNNETVIPETTLDVYAYTRNNDDVSFTKLEQGVVYRYDANDIRVNKYDFNDIRINAPFEEDLLDVMASITIMSNGNVMVSTENNGIRFGVGETHNNLRISCEQTDDTFTFTGNHTVGFAFSKLDSDTISWTSQVAPPGTVRELTISAWYEKNRDMTGDPQVKITMRLTRASISPEDFTLEILSIERTPPAYW